MRFHSKATSLMPRSGTYYTFLTAAIFIAILVFHRMLCSIANNIESVSSKHASINNEQLPIYDLPSSLLHSFPQNEPPHLTPIDPSQLLQRGVYSIDTAHRQGALHTGHCLFLMDANEKLLFLKRSSQVVTCPDTWSILGEHSIAGEESIEAVTRALQEELGLDVTVQEDLLHPVGYGYSIDLDYSRRDFVELSNNGNNNNSNNNNLHHGEDKITVTIQNVTEFPLYYIRYYGPRNDNRIDRQLTYLWLVQLPKPQEEIHWKLDEEVADHKWITMDEFESWLNHDEQLSELADLSASLAAIGSSSEGQKEENKSRGPRDDGPPFGDFCHGTIRSLYKNGWENLKFILEDEE